MQCALAGYDVSTPESYEATIASFDEIVGLKYLKGMHINDSKCDILPARPRLVLWRVADALVLTAARV